MMMIRGCDGGQSEEEGRNEMLNISKSKRREEEEEEEDEAGG